MAKLTVYQRIIRAANKGKGLHLTVDEVLVLALEDSIERRALLDDHGIVDQYDKMSMARIRIGVCNDR